MSKTKSTSRCRKWQLTINNPMEHEMEHKAIKEILNTFPSLVYWCMGDEIGNDTNTYHTHIYMYAKHPIRFTTLKNKFPMAHLECANGSSKENRDYILKCEKWEKDAKVETRVDGTFEEWGDIPNDTPLRFGDNQKHFGTLYRLIEEGLSDGEIIAYNPNYIPMISKFQLIRNAINEKSFSYDRRDNLEIHYIYGPYRWDKVKRIRDKFGDMDIYSISNYENPNHSTSGASLGVLLLFCTGLRVGELVAIRTSNIYDDYIWIEEEEQRDYIISIDEKIQKLKCTYNGTKVGKAKTSASFRKVDLTNEAKQIIEMVRNANKENGFKDEDFLFVNATQRMQENTILKRIYKFCDEPFIEKRSPHKVRKTFASILVNDGIMDISEVAQLLGHVSEQTLINHYLYPTKSSETRRERLEKALAM